MTSKEADKLRLQSLYGLPEQREVAIALFKLSADMQNWVEAAWSIKKLCRVIERDARRLSMSERQESATVVIEKTNGECQVFDCRDINKSYASWRKIPLPVSGAQAIFTGKLCNYWSVTLQGRTT